VNNVTRDLEAEINELIGQLLKLPSTRTGALSRSELAEWDSLKHMELVFALEDRYGVRFDETEFPILVSTDAIAATLRKHRAS
jgi:acyl carrier protein